MAPALPGRTAGPGLVALDNAGPSVGGVGRHGAQGRPCRVPGSPIQRRTAFTGALARPAADSCTTGRVRAVQGQNSGSRGDILVTREKRDWLIEG